MRHAYHLQTEDAGDVPDHEFYGTARRGVHALLDYAAACADHPYVVVEDGEPDCALKLMALVRRLEEDGQVLVKDASNCDLSAHLVARRIQ